MGLSKIAKEDKENVSSGGSVPSSFSWLSTIKDVLASAQSLFTIGAIVAGAWWFAEQHQDQPRIKIDQVVSQRTDPDNEKNALITVEVRVTNLGNVRADITTGKLSIDQVNQSGETLKEDIVPEFLLEPGEVDQAYFHTFTLTKAIRVIQLHSSFQTPDPRYYWRFTSVFDVDVSNPEKKSSLVPITAATSR